MTPNSNSVVSTDRSVCICVCARAHACTQAISKCKYSEIYMLCGGKAMAN